MLQSCGSAIRCYKVLQGATRCYKVLQGTCQVIPLHLQETQVAKRHLQLQLLLAQSGATPTIFWSVSVSNNVLPLAFPPPRNTSCRNTFDDETTVGPIRWRDQNNTKKTTRPTNQLPSRALCDIVKLLRAPSNTEPLVDHVFYTHHN